MSTQKKIEANRKNAQKSTGPKSAAGKAIVAQNTAPNLHSDPDLADKPDGGEALM